MPEGDTVWLAAKRLRAAFAGTTLTKSDFRVPALATADLANSQVHDVVSRGKHLLTRVGDGLTLHTHFEMDGSWHLYKVGQRWTGGAGHQVRIVLANEQWVAVGYRMPVIELLRTADEHRVVGHLGPDLLGPDWDEEEALRRIAARPDREIGPALLDQRNLAGIGNLYKTESLFLRGVTPWTRVADVDTAALVGTARRLMLANREVWTQSTTGDTRRGGQHWVFERRTCLRCGARIRSAEQVEKEQPRYGRICYWCPRCQSGPAPS